jgi:hypothetical protein
VPAAGAPAAPAAPAADVPKEKKIQAVLFHAIIRWNDKSDPDLEPVETAGPAPTEKKPAPGRKR